MNKLMTTTMILGKEIQKLESIKSDFKRFFLNGQLEGGYEKIEEFEKIVDMLGMVRDEFLQQHAESLY